MGDTRDEIEKAIKQLERQRDELRLKMHLGKAEAREEWEKLERQWEHVRARLPKLREALGDTKDDVGAALKLTAEEIRRGYERLRRLF
jgi:predicted  nucleic acid-binding Zn-ribbon protein